MKTISMIDSPIGPLLIEGDEAVEAIHMLDSTADVPSGREVSTHAFPEAREQLSAYFEGKLTAFSLHLAPTGTPFQMRVWDRLREIPFGTTVSYGLVARDIGSPSASRAVGLAAGRNPIPIVVPCHRVIGSTGKLTGYAGGLHRKQTLLAHEANMMIESSWSSKASA